MMRLLKISICVCAFLFLQKASGQNSNHTTYNKKLDKACEFKVDKKPDMFRMNIGADLLYLTFKKRYILEYGVFITPKLETFFTAEYSKPKVYYYSKANNYYGLGLNYYIYKNLYMSLYNCIGFKGFLDKKEEYGYFMGTGYKFNILNRLCINPGAYLGLKGSGIKLKETHVLFKINLSYKFLLMNSSSPTWIGHVVRS